MIDGLGAALSALSAQTQRMDALANDTANLNTIGALQRVGDGEYAPTSASGAPMPASSATLRQGALESSNVDFADTAVGMIEARSSYAAAISALHVQDEMWSALLELHDGSGRR